MVKGEGEMQTENISNAYRDYFGREYDDYPETRKYEVTLTIEVVEDHHSEDPAVWDWADLIGESVLDVKVRDV